MVLKYKCPVCGELHNVTIITNLNEININELMENE